MVGLWWGFYIDHRIGEFQSRNGRDVAVRINAPDCIEETTKALLMGYAVRTDLCFDDGFNPEGSIEDHANAGYVLTWNGTTTVRP